MSKLTRERLTEVVSYDPQTGDFHWLIKTKGKDRTGEKAGTLDQSRGYVRISIDGKKYAAHQLAWLYVHGEWVKGLDHKNHLRHDNRIDNLRIATNSQNSSNTKQKLGASGIRGVSWCKKRKAWRARIQVNRKSITLGYFETTLEADIAYTLAADIHHGEFRYG